MRNNYRPNRALLAKKLKYIGHKGKMSGFEIDWGVLLV